MKQNYFYFFYHFYYVGSIFHKQLMGVSNLIQNTYALHKGKESIQPDSNIVHRSNFTVLLYISWIWLLMILAYSSVKKEVGSGKQ